MIVSRAGLAAMAIVDCVMVARFDARQLAFTTLAEGTFGRLLDVCAAFMLSGLVLVAAAHARGDGDQRAAIWRRAAAVAAALGLVAGLVSLLGRPILALMGQSADLVHGGGAVIFALGLGAPAGLIAMASAVSLEGARKPVFVAICVIGANLLNLAINWLLIGGQLGFPALGAVGSALSTSLVRCALAIALVIGLRQVEGRRLWARSQGGGEARAQWRLGWSASATAGGMHALAIWLTVFAGWLSARPLAAYASCWVLNLPGMLLAMGLGDAIAMRVAGSDLDARGHRRWTSVRTDLGAVALVLSPFVLLFCAAPTMVARLYTGDTALQAIMASLLPLSGLALLLDGLSYSVAAALRGRGDVIGPTVIQLACMAATPVLAATLAFGLHMGVRGMVLAIVVTSTLRLALLALRQLAPGAAQHGRPQPQLEGQSAWG
jgi:MATE family multidrug resistance protein